MLVDKNNARVDYCFLVLLSIFIQQVNNVNYYDIPTTNLINSILLYDYMISTAI